MYAVIKKDSNTLLHICSSKEDALVACQVEKSKVSFPERKNITAVTMDDEGFSDIRF
ncbi:MAG: hypothetical protein K6C08_00810 [Oscillospiraceae bacterium]|nr:hypothetical protein [Oscillospiraceae bacterium]